MHYPRLAAGLSIVIGFVACAQVPGTPEPREQEGRPTDTRLSMDTGPSDTAPAFADSVTDRLTRRAKQSAR